jgi:hypothetical protein
MKTAVRLFLLMALLLAALATVALVGGLACSGSPPRKWCA